MKKIISVLLVFLLLSFWPSKVCASPTLVDTSASQFTNYDSDIYTTDSKIHFYVDDNDKYYNIYDIESCIEGFNYMKALHSRVVLENELIIVTVRFNNDFSETDAFASKSKAVSSAKDECSEQIARKQLYAASKEYHDKHSKENVTLLNGIKYQKAKIIDYTPYIELQIDIEDIDIYYFYALSETTYIKDIAFSFDTDATTDTAWNTVLDEIGAYDIVSAGTYTGQDVRIGILEYGGVCDTSNSNLADKSISICNTDGAVSTSTTHATEVASIISTIAPDAELYVYGFSNSFNLGWFADNQCSVINCSFSMLGTTQNTDGTYNAGVSGYRTDVDGVFDYFVETTLITVVVAAGNRVTDSTQSNYNPDGNITSPGLAYNVITVGGVERSWSWFKYNVEHADDACYVSSVPYVKPELSAFFDVNIPGMGSASGTSFAAPQVAACIALLIDKSPSAYDHLPAKIKAVLIANATETADYNTDRGNFDSRVGAGVINLESIIDNIYRTRTSTVSGGTPSGTQILSYTISLSAGAELQVALSWYMHFVPSSNSGYLADYNLYLLDSSGSIVAKSVIAGFANIEMLRYDVEETGSYRIVIKLSEDLPTSISSEPIYMAYKIA